MCVGVNAVRMQGECCSCHCLEQPYYGRGLTSCVFLCRAAIKHHCTFEPSSVLCPCPIGLGPSCLFAHVWQATPVAPPHRGNDPAGHAALSAAAPCSCTWCSCPPLCYQHMLLCTRWWCPCAHPCPPTPAAHASTCDTKPLPCTHSLAPWVAWQGHQVLGGSSGPQRVRPCGATVPGCHQWCAPGPNRSVQPLAGPEAGGRHCWPFWPQWVVGPKQQVLGRPIGTQRV